LHFCNPIQARRQGLWIEQRLDAAFIYVILKATIPKHTRRKLPMDNRRKFSLFCISTLIVVLAVGCLPGGVAPASMAGFWADPDNNVTTIEDQGGSYVVVTVLDLNQAQGQNLLVSTSYWNRMLTWRYCPAPKPCMTLIATAYRGGDTMDVTWTNANGEEGRMSLKRVDKGTN
jgi:hypothetical protein